jgi:hypothetical protein
MIRWKDHGDKGSKVFYRSMRPRSALSNITELINEEGVHCHDQAQLEEICYLFYSRLYQQRPMDPMAIRAQVETLARIQPRLTGAMIDLLLAPVSLDELTKALSEMAR